MGSEAWNNVRNLPHQSDQSAHVNLAIFFQLTQIFVKQLCHVGELSTFEPQAVALEPINTVGSGSWGLICGQIDL